MSPKLPAGYDKEIGAPGLASFGGILESWEQTPELTFPNSIVVFDRMRRTDAQVKSVLNAIKLPILATRWYLGGDDVDDRVLRACEVELGLGKDGTGRRRRRGQGIVFQDFMAHALLMLPLGFMAFEQVYEPGPPAPELDAGLALMAHIKKLAPRMPRSILSLDVASDGGLKSIKQYVPKDKGRWEMVEIPIERLVMFVHEQEGADWYGNSILRQSWSNFIIKDVLLRIGPMAVERNGMGLPVVGYPEGGDRNIALQIAKQARAGDEAGVALPDGYTFELKGIEGTVTDSIPLLNFHNQEMARSVLAMFLDLGHDRGARSLGETFVNFFVLSLNAVCEHIAEVVTEHVLRDFVELNYGTDEAYPELCFDPIEPGAEVTMQGLAALVQVGAIDVDDPNFRQALLRRLSLPAPANSATTGVPDPAVPEPTADKGNVVDLYPHMSAGDFDQETAQIAVHRLSAEAQVEHEFKAARWSDVAGHPRCALCGGPAPRVGTNCTGLAAFGTGHGLDFDALEARVKAARERYAALQG